MPYEKRLSVCGLCGGKCFVNLYMENREIAYVEKAYDRSDVNGNICLRGAALKQYLNHPDRLRHPLLRAGAKGSGDFRRISWDKAFELIAERLKKDRDNENAKATVFFSGHPKWYRYMLSELARDYGTPNYCTESSTCFTAADIAYKLCYGMPVQRPDLKECRTLICWGANPAYTKLDSVNGVLDIIKRGANLIVVDPRITPTAARATLHLRPRSGTDGALALAIANVIFSEGLTDDGYLRQYAHGIDDYKDYVSNFTPDKAERITGVPANDIIAAGRMIGNDTPLSIFTSSCGIAHTPNGVQNYRAVFLLEAITGSFDCRGGNHGGLNPSVKLNGGHHAAKARVNVEEEFCAGRFPVWNELVNNEGQAMCLDEAILNGSPYPIHNLIAFGMNYGMFPDSERMRRALLNTEFFVDVDLFMTDSARCADLVLPAEAAPEMEYIYAIKQNRLIYLPPVIDSGNCLNDVEIILGICRKLGLNGKFTGMRTYDEYLQWMLEPTGLNLMDLKAAPEGLPARRLSAGSSERFKSGLKTPSGKIEFASEVLKKFDSRSGYAALPEFNDYLSFNPDKGRYPYVLCAGAKLPQFFHSRTYRLPWLSNLEKHTAVSISPEDAQNIGLEDGSRLRLSTPVGERVFLTNVDSGVPSGTVFVMHDGIENQNINELISAEYYDPVSGFPGFRSYFCGIQEVGGRE